MTASRSARGARGDGSAGFLLLETLIAVAIMSLVLVVLPGSIVTSKSMVERSLSRVSARLVAESVLAGEFAPQTLAAGLRSGTLDGYAWTAQIRPRASLVQLSRPTSWTPYDIILQVSGSDGTTLTVETLRVAATRRR